MNSWYKIAKSYGDILPPTVPGKEEGPMPVFIDKNGTRTQIENVMLIPETYNDFKDIKIPDPKNNWVGWGVAIKSKKGWKTVKWFINMWEAEEYAKNKYGK